MLKYFFSPFLICFLIGLVNSIVSLILLFIFLNIDCGDYKICLLLRHLVIFFFFIEFNDNILEIIGKFEDFKFIIIIITSLIEVFAIFIFYEKIELNFCGLNVNLKKNIIYRAESDIYSILDINEEKEDENDNNNEDNIEKLMESSQDNDSVYWFKYNYLNHLYILNINKIIKLN